MEAHVFCANFKSGKVDATGLYGRIIRGKKDTDFETLSDEPLRRLAFVMGSDGLQKLVGMSGYEMLVEIGYSARHCRDLVEDGNKFKLVVFPEPGVIRLADWDGLIANVCHVYPELADRIQLQVQQLKALTEGGDVLRKFGELEEKAGFKFSEVKKSGRNDPRFITPERYLQSSGDLIQTRGFLYLNEHVREAYTGDGWTLTMKGQRGVKEYSIVNHKLPALDAAILDLEVQLPD